MKVDVLSKSPAATKRRSSICRTAPSPISSKRGRASVRARWQFKTNNMIDHIILTVSDIDRSLTFYEESLALNIRYFMPYKGENGHPDLWGFGDGKRAFFWLKQGTPDPQAIHWGFKAESNTAVESFYKAAI